ncbi:cobalamin adenosyltransferase [Paenibacillus thiaminolyticus]|nr:cobalamin adenosyltransferase [Paenibacillus thiaminolyticus]
MKFITEMELRNVYRIEPFTSYMVEHGSRLTPEARQFLTDRQIAVSYSTQEQNQEQSKSRSQSAATGGKAGLAAWEAALSDAIRLSPVLVNRAGAAGAGCAARSEGARAVEAVFGPPERGRRLRIHCRFIFPGLYRHSCRCSFEDAGDCFEVTEFHIQLEKGREIALLHRLRCALRELGFAVLEAAAGSPKKSRRNLLFLESTI